MSDTRLDRLEERMAELMRHADDLSEVIARQEQEIARLTSQVRLLLEREAARQSDEAGSVYLGDERPPHY